MDDKLIPKLRKMAISGLGRMFVPEENLFIYCIRKNKSGINPEEISLRYTAITLIGLANEKKETIEPILGKDGLERVLNKMKGKMESTQNLGDVALSFWAAHVHGFKEMSVFRDRFIQLDPVNRKYSTVELSWALDASCLDTEISGSDYPVRLAERLMISMNGKTGIFPHVVGGNQRSLRSHVSCFADAVYPIHALSSYYRLSGEKGALEAASKCAEKICEMQGKDGQWWWHYDYRTGDVIEGYPVYSVHQDSMAPMCLIALKEAGGPDFMGNINKGLDWLEYSPEINGSLIDKKADLIWRKVARREPNKFTRYAQTIASRINPKLRMPGMDILFPPTTIDYENRPYHLGWILYAWGAKGVR